MFKQQTIYELPLTRDYVRHWGLMEAIRELFQNAIDGGEWNWNLESEFSSEREKASGEPPSVFTLTISSPNVRLPASSLVLGETSKHNDERKIGAFGEGFKLALLVLARLNVDVKMLNDSLRWEPCFVHSKDFDTEVFAIRESKAVEHADKGLEYVIYGLTADQVEGLKSCFLFMREFATSTEDIYFNVSQGKIFREEQSAIYVGGLFICATKLEFSYDLKPGVITLERDRQTVADFELQWLTKDMWIATEQWDRIAKMIAAESKDVEYIHYSCPELLKEAVYKQFLENNPGGIMARSLEQMQSLVKAGMEKVVYVGGGYGSIVCSAQPERITAKLEQATPAEALQKWLSHNRQYLRTPAIVSMKELIAEAQNWKNSQ